MLTSGGTSRGELAQTECGTQKTRRSLSEAQLTRVLENYANTLVVTGDHMRGNEEWTPVTG